MFSSYVVVGVRSYLSKICHDDDEGPMTMRKTFRFCRHFSRNSFRKNLFDFGVTRSDRCVDRIRFFQHSLRTFDQFISKFHLCFRCDFSFVNFADFHVSFVLKENRRRHLFFQMFDRKVLFSSTIVSTSNKKQQHSVVFRLFTMAFTPYQFFLAALMLITGSINTLSTKWADR